MNANLSDKTRYHSEITAVGLNLLAKKGKHPFFD